MKIEPESDSHGKSVELITLTAFVLPLVPAPAGMATSPTTLSFVPSLMISCTVCALVSSEVHDLVNARTISTSRKQAFSCCAVSVDDSHAAIVDHAWKIGVTFAAI